jgi:hypothetical protein
VQVEAIDFFYLSMPQILDIGDGSQDALSRPRICARIATDRCARRTRRGSASR